MKVGLFLDALPANAPFPAHLVLCNLADTKRRNAHLGFDVVDADIARFEAELAAAVAAPGRSCRVAGDIWLALTGDPEALVDRVMSRYHTEVGYRAGWRCRAVQGGEVSEVAEAITTRIVRSCRFVGTLVEQRDAVAAAAAYLEAEGWGIDPGAYVSLPPVPARAAERWECVGAYPATPFYCPFCSHDRFAWNDGDTSVYSGDGHCRGCNAEVSFHDAGGLIEP